MKRNQHIWIARAKSGFAELFTVPPERNGYTWYSRKGGLLGTVGVKAFPQVTFENSPQAFEIIPVEQITSRNTAFVELLAEAYKELVRIPESDRICGRVNGIHSAIEKAVDDKTYREIRCKALQIANVDEYDVNNILGGLII